MGGSSRRSGAREVLGVGGRRVGAKRCVARKCIRAAEETWEEIKNTIEIEVETELPAIASTQNRHIVDELKTFDRSLARAEVVAANAQIRAGARADYGFRSLAVGQAGFFITRKLKTKLVDDSIRQ